MGFLFPLNDQFGTIFAIYLNINQLKQTQMNKLHIVVAETMGTDGEFYSEVYPCKSSEDAHDTMCSLIADMAETMGYDLPTEDICITTELNGDDWWYRVRDTTHDFPIA